MIHAYFTVFPNVDENNLKAGHLRTSWISSMSRPWNKTNLEYVHSINPVIMPILWWWLWNKYVHSIPNYSRSQCSRKNNCIQALVTKENTVSHTTYLSVRLPLTFVVSFDGHQSCVLTLGATKTRLNNKLIHRICKQNVKKYAANLFPHLL